MQYPDQQDWFVIKDIDQIASPSLVIYPDRVKENIQRLIKMAGSVERLRPHIKTCKSPEAIRLLQAAGISKFKCATIAEAELLGNCEVNDVVLAYQPVGPNILRFVKLMLKFPKTNFSCLVDSLEIAHLLNKVAEKNKLSISIYIDINVGMNRTGILPEDAYTLIKDCLSLPNLALKGLHCYDGHIHDSSLEERRRKCESYSTKINRLKALVNEQHAQNLTLIAGGTPTFPIHVNNRDVTCSPGTFIFWDKGYQDLFTEQDFLPSALVITRIISIIDSNKLCLDLGHKAVAAENVLARRAFFLNAPNAKVISHSEEHLVIEIAEGHSFALGDVIYALPYHICPTVALYDKAVTIVEHYTNNTWNITARQRIITI
ncbi:MAG TPA: D-TA family PLP-dependent enzyme [Pseudosphingobacterium sp.]|nr:D-TA family PLP-dependent enzyme [Pseudosphingobacterium sp.]